MTLEKINAANRRAMLQRRRAALPKKTLEKRVVAAAMEVYKEMRRQYPATHMLVVEDLLGTYKLTPASVKQIRACHDLYESQKNK